MRRLLLAFVALLLACSPPLPEGWIVVAPDETGFRVAMPRMPESRTQSVETPAGTIVMHVYTLDEGYRSMSVAYGDYPGGLIEANGPDPILDGARDGAVANLRGTLVSHDRIRSGFHQGRDVAIASPDGELLYRMRFFLIDRRLYQIIAVAKPEEAQGGEVQAFLDSFVVSGP